MSQNGGKTPTSYKCNRGDMWLNWDWHESRGTFGRGDKLLINFASVSDGTSNTMAVSEAIIGVQNSRRVGEAIAVDTSIIADTIPPDHPPSLCLQLVGPNRQFTGTIQGPGSLPGWRWADGRNPYTFFYPMLPPNGPSCGRSGEDWCLLTASSRHPGGVNVLVLDGAVKFISETIDAGDPTRTTGLTSRPQDYSGPSLYGVWGALGSAYGKESVAVP